MKRLFESYLNQWKENPNRKPLIINELTALFNTPVVSGETLLFIDEIQLLPEALVSLRYFYEEMP